MQPLPPRFLPFAQFNSGVRLLLLGAFFLGSVVVLGLAAVVWGKVFGDGRNAMLAIAAAQDVICFALPSWLLAFYSKPDARGALGMRQPGRGVAWAWMICIAVAAWPAMEQLVAWNEALPLAADNPLRRMEAEAQAAAAVLLGDASVWGLVSGVLVVGMLTGLCEELFFRAGVQRILREGGLNRHAAVWIAAFVFSALHFQVFGFVPRLLMGAFFGYLYAWSGSVWLAAGAHALNNSVVVIFSWVSLHTGQEYELSEAAMTWLAPVSAALTALLLTLWYKQRKRGQLTQNQIYGSKE